MPQRNEFTRRKLFDRLIDWPLIRNTRNIAVLTSVFTVVCSFLMLSEQPLIWHYPKYLLAMFFVVLFYGFYHNIIVLFLLLLFERNKAQSEKDEPRLRKARLHPVHAQKAM
jgi:hypothetical protein